MAVFVVCLFLLVLWVGLWSVIVAFPGHTRLLKILVGVLRGNYAGDENMPDITNPLEKNVIIVNYYQPIKTHETGCFLAFDWLKTAPCENLFATTRHNSPKPRSCESQCETFQKGSWILT